ncbi:MAG: CRISPR system precrRNA processing endoribonuclease RAMP protein Cas6 [Candidatus Caldarchaeum sp.]
MVVSYCLRMVSLRPLEVKFFSGYAVRGVFFHALKSVDPEFATRVHEQRFLSPYSVSPIETVKGRSFFYGVINPGVPFQFRITALNDRVAEVFGRFLLSGEVPRIVVCGVDVSLNEVSVVNWDRETSDGGVDASRFEVVFQSPTYFRSTQKGAGLLGSLLPRRLRPRVRPVYRYVIVPDPYLFFRSLARLFRQFGHGNFRYRSFSDWLLEGGVALETYRGLRAYKVYESNGRWSRGFVGRAVFSIPSDLYDVRMARICSSLLRFSFFSNVGGNRTAGFGVVSHRFLNLGGGMGNE